MKVLTYIARVNGKDVKTIRFSVKSSWTSLLDTAEVEVAQEVEEGAKIELLGGYNALNTIFEGYVIISEKTDYGYKLKCEDPNTLLKNETVTLYFPGGSLNDLLAKAGIQAHVNVKATLNPYRFTNATKLEVLNALKKEGIQAFLRQGKLVVGLPYLDPQNQVEFWSFGQKNEIITNNLQSSKIDLRKLVLEGVNINSKDNSRSTLYCYYKNNKVVFSKIKPQGEIRTLYFTDLSTQELKERLESYITKKLKTGLTGSFTTFVHKIVHPEDAILLHTEEGDKKLYVKEVNYDFSFSGGRQKIIIDYEVT